MLWKRIFFPEAIEPKFQKNQSKVLIIKLDEIHKNFKSQPQRVSTVKVRALLGKEWDPITWDRDVWKDATEAENFEPSGFQGFISPEEVVSTPSAEDVPESHPPFHLCLRKLILCYLIKSKQTNKEQRILLKEMPDKTILVSHRATNSCL